ncbi:MAG: DUF4114 domain-containing protein [Cyanobacteria bacterium SID2]|nr:DUF4114 domain-containing protein [Cyanobacteria bacterium SID2]MBP0004201.1 DUF4114 domain-containing protein [Cyanobacteria bacterium SBC]
MQSALLKRTLTLTASTAIAIGTSLATESPAAAAVMFGDSIDCPGPAVTEACSLQSLLDDITVAGPGIDTVNDQTGFEYFTNTASGGSVASFMFEIAKFENINKFGLFNATGDLVELFAGVNDPGDSSMVNFLDNGDVSVVTQQFGPGASDPTPVFSLYEDFGNVFGFYLETQNGQLLFSDSSLNPGGSQQSVIYQGDNQTVLDLPGKAPGTFSDNEFIIAFEDRYPGQSFADFDYNDLVVMVESIEPLDRRVPEPSMLFGLGIVAVAILGSRRRQSHDNG